MPDLALSTTVTRTLLGLGPLQLNDHDRYMVSPDFLGAQVTWRRNTASSPFFDDEVEISATRGRASEQIGVEVDGDGPALKANMDELTAALIQRSYVLTATTPAGTWSYRCAAADYQGQLTGPRLMFGRVLMVFTIPRSPVALAGVV